MNHHRSQLTLRQCRVKLLKLFFSQGLRNPLPLVLAEHLERVGSNSQRLTDRIVQPTSN